MNSTRAAAFPVLVSILPILRKKAEFGRYLLVSLTDRNVEALAIEAVPESFRAFVEPHGTGDAVVAISASGVPVLTTLAEIDRYGHFTAILQAAQSQISAIARGGQS